MSVAVSNKQMLLLVCLIAIACAHSHTTKEEIQAELNEKTIYYGSSVRLRNAQTRHHLYSMDVQFGSGSRGQVITATESDSEVNSLFSIKNGSSKPVQTFRDAVKCGDVIRLEHSSTSKHITASGYASPISQKMEVSGQNASTDNSPSSGDNFLVECVGEKNGAELKGKTEFFLQHVQSGQYLCSSRKFFFNRSNCGQQCPILDHHEVSCQRVKDAEAKWKIVGGVLLQKSQWEDDKNDDEFSESNDFDEPINSDGSKKKAAAGNVDEDGYQEIEFSHRGDL